MFELMQAEAALYTFRQHHRQGAPTQPPSQPSTIADVFEVMVDRVFMTAPPVDHNAVKALAKRFPLTEEKNDDDCMPSLRSCPVPSRHALLLSLKDRSVTATAPSPSIRVDSSKHSAVLFDKRCEAIAAEGRSIGHSDPPSWIEATMIPMRMAKSVEIGEKKDAWIDAVHDRDENEHHRLATPVMVLGARRKVMQPTAMEVSCTPPWVIYDTQPPRNGLTVSHQGAQESQGFADRGSTLYKHVVDGLSEFNNVLVRKDVTPATYDATPKAPTKDDLPGTPCVAAQRRAAFMQSLDAMGASVLPPRSAVLLPSTITRISSSIPELLSVMDSSHEKVNEPMRGNSNASREKIPQHSPFMRRTATAVLADPCDV